MKREIVIPAILVMGLFLAGGAYSQLAQGNEIQESISRGLAYLGAQPQFDSELLVMYMIQAKSEKSELTQALAKTSKTDEFHYPLKQFVSGKSIDEGKISSKTLEAPFYSDFIGYFECKPLTQEWIDSLASQQDSENEPYNAAHGLWVLSLLRQDYLNGRCGDNPAFAAPLDAAIETQAKQVQAGLGDKSFFDAWVERVAVLGYAGYPISDEDVAYILSRQAENGGWAPQEFEGETFNEERPHTTALAVWALVEVSS